jgi:hypothetical protein
VPLHPDEIEVLRQMIDEYRYRKTRGVFFSRAYGRTRLVIVALLGLAMFMLQVAAVYYSSRAHSPTVIVRSHK